MTIPRQDYEELLLASQEAVDVLDHLFRAYVEKAGVKDGKHPTYARIETFRRSLRKAEQRLRDAKVSGQA